MLPQLASRRLIRKARKNRFLRMVYTATDEKSGAEYRGP
jgi:hypothetical protein